MPKTLTSRTALLVGAAVLLATTAVGVTLAAPAAHRHGQDVSSESYGETGHHRFASEHGARRHHEGRHERHAENDDDDDEGGPRNGPVPRMADPYAPVPDNGLFNGKARPKVDVQ